MFYDLENKKVKNFGENWSASSATIIGDVTLLPVVSFLISLLIFCFEDAELDDEITSELIFFDTFIFVSL